MADLRAQIAKLRAKLTDTNLTESRRAFIAAAIAQRQATFVRLQDAQTAQKTRASFATVALELETKKAAVVVPSKPGRIGEALANIGRVLVTEAEILLYVLLIGAPFAILAALLWIGRRSFRRRSEEELLARWTDPDGSRYHRRGGYDEKAESLGSIAAVVAGAALAVVWPLVGFASSGHTAATLGSSTLIDATGDAFNGGPDIGTVEITDDSAGKISVTVPIVNRPS